MKFTIRCPLTNQTVRVETQHAVKEVPSLVFLDLFDDGSYVHPKLAAIDDYYETVSNLLHEDERADLTPYAVVEVEVYGCNPEHAPERARRAAQPDEFVTSVSQGVEDVSEVRTDEQCIGWAIFALDPEKFIAASYNDRLALR